MLTIRRINVPFTKALTVTAVAIAVTSTARPCAARLPVARSYGRRRGCTSRAPRVGRITAIDSVSRDASDGA